jgi:hypothetical protein
MAYTAFGPPMSAKTAASRPERNVMRVSTGFVVLLLYAASAWAQTVSEDEKKQGFVPLFDGKSFEGWKTTEKTAASWKVEDGLLVLLGGNVNLYTQDEFDDFVLRLEFRPKKMGYNSGLFLRGNNQINLAQKDAGRLMTSKKTKPVPELHRPPGEWNEWEVTCVGPKVSLKVNGKPAWEIDDFKPAKGAIGLQAEGQAIDFRNLRIRKVRK